MILGRFTLAMFLLTVPAVWGQYSRADMVKLAADRFDTAAKKLKLSPDQATAIQPLLQSKYVDIGQVKDVYRASACRSPSLRSPAGVSLKVVKPTRASVRENGTRIWRQLRASPIVSG